jgi:hypothetical protein
MNEINRDIALQSLAALAKRVETLEAEADIRRIQARYMFLCDTPCPEPGVENDAERVERILELYTEDAVWEGVGALREHFEAFWGQKRDPALLLNVHYLTSEQIHVQGAEADGQWVHCQPWIFSDGSSLLRSSRLNNLFRKVDGVWKVARTRTENVFVAPLNAGWANNVPDRSVLMR